MRILRYMPNHETDFDVAVAGAGPAGTAAAIELALAGARVLVVEEKKFPRSKLCGEFISPECQEHFKRLGVSEDMIAGGGEAISATVFYSRRGLRVAIPSEWFSGGNVALGLSRREMDQRLLKRAKDLGVSVVEEAHASGVISADGTVRGLIVKQRDETKHYRASLTIDATGRSRALARTVESPPRTGKNRLVAFKSHLSGTRLEKAACEIYFYKNGYGGLNDVENGLSNLCFIVAAADVRRCNSDPATVMREVVMKNARAEYTLRYAQPASSWLSVSLEGFGRRNVAPAPGLLTIGDAASFIDPFTGSGILMALESGHLAATLIKRHLPKLPDGLEKLAREYTREHAQTFNSRFRTAGLLRRAAFVPGLAETAISISSTSSWLRQKLARATRRSSTDFSLWSD